ncbi:MAG: nitrilase-related carbon-nitrogen hydrolase, partial [Conexibacter sp.]
MSAIEVIAATGAPADSPARVRDPRRGAFRVGAVQHRWHDAPAAHEVALAEGIRLAAEQGARLVCLQELTLSPYFAVDADPSPEALARAEAIPDGPTSDFARRMAAETGAYVHASLYERADADAPHPPPPRDKNRQVGPPPRAHGRRTPQHHKPRPGRHTPAPGV